MKVKSVFILSILSVSFSGFDAHAAIPQSFQKLWQKYSTKQFACKRKRDNIKDVILTFMGPVERPVISVRGALNSNKGEVHFLNVICDKFAQDSTKCFLDTDYWFLNAVHNDSSTIFNDQKAMTVVLTFYKTTGEIKSINAEVKDASRAQDGGWRKVLECDASDIVDRRPH